MNRILMPLDQGREKDAKPRGDALDLHIAYLLRRCHLDVGDGWRCSRPFRFMPVGHHQMEAP